MSEEEKYEEEKEQKREEKKTATTPQVNPVVKYFRETRGELSKVTWPTREESQRLTVIVLLVTIFMALFLGLLDFSFSNLLRLLLEFVAI